MSELKVNFLIFAKAMSEEKKRGFWERWRYKYRFVVLNSDNFEERLSFRLSRLNLFVLSSFALVFLIGGTTLLISLTPLREYIPGYTSTNMRRQVVELNHLSDSLLAIMKGNDQYLANIRFIIDGKSPKGENETTRNSSQIIDNVVFETITEDSVLRKQIEEEERFSLFASANNKMEGVEDILFFTPIKGVITQSFNAKDQHFGIDIVSKENEAVKATLDGVVALSSWTSETGYVIALLHDNNLFSVYKHNSVLLKQQGDKVVVGEAIAIIGNSGDLSTGPHLHFELWHNNKPIDPEHYIVF